MAIEKHNYLAHIVIDPGILVGKPVIKGTRIPVSLILNLLGNGYDIPRICEAYPDLSAGDVKSALEYSEARINREEVRPFDHSV